MGSIPIPRTNRVSNPEKRRMKMNEETLEYVPYLLAGEDDDKDADEEDEDDDDDDEDEDDDNSAPVE